MKKIDKIKALIDYLRDLRGEVKIHKSYVEMILDIYEYEESMSFGDTFYILTNVKEVGLYADLEVDEYFRTVLPSCLYNLYQDLKKKYIDEENLQIKDLVKESENQESKRRRI